MELKFQVACMKINFFFSYTSGVDDDQGCAFMHTQHS